MIGRKATLYIRVFALFVLGSVASPMFAGGLPIASDLRLDGRESLRARMPIMIFFAAEYCPYCELVNDLYLQPMFESGEYRDKILFRVIDVDGHRTLYDFSGEKTDHAAFANKQGASLTPIIRLYDHVGRELVPELLGYTSPDFYAGFLEQAIDMAVAKLREQGAVTQR